MRIEERDRQKELASSTTEYHSYERCARPMLVHELQAYRGGVAICFKIRFVGAEVRFDSLTPGLIFSIQEHSPS